jgi:hypothetical protein
VNADRISTVKDITTVTLIHNPDVMRVAQPLSSRCQRRPKVVAGLGSQHMPV